MSKKAIQFSAVFIAGIFFGILISCLLIFKDGKEFALPESVRFEDQRNILGPKKKAGLFPYKFDVMYTNWTVTRGVIGDIKIDEAATLEIRGPVAIQGVGLQVHHAQQDNGWPLKVTYDDPKRPQEGARFSFLSNIRHSPDYDIYKASPRDREKEKITERYF